MEQFLTYFHSSLVGVTGSAEELKAITKKFGFEYCNVPKKYLAEGINDWADLAKHYGLKVIEDYLINKSIIGSTLLMAYETFESSSLII